MQEESIYVPQYHIDTEYPASILFDAKQHEIHSKDDLENLVVVGLKDYGLEHFLPKSVTIYGVDNHKKMKELVMNHRVDAAIVYSHNAIIVDPDKKLTALEIIPDNKYFLGFYSSEFGQQLVKQYDDELPKLILNNTIRNNFIDEADYQHANFTIKKD